MTVDVIRAPFTPEQVRLLNQYQVRGFMHPFTCGGCRDLLGTRMLRETDGTLRPLTDEEFMRLPDLEGVVYDDRLLVATENGWVCPTCSYTQEWAHSFMADPEAHSRWEDLSRRMSEG